MFLYNFFKGGNIVGLSTPLLIPLSTRVSPLGLQANHGTR